MVNHKQYYRVTFENVKKWKEEIDCIIHPLKFHQFKTYVKESSEKGFLICRLKNENCDKQNLESWEIWNKYANVWENLTISKFNSIIYIDYPL